MELLAKKNLADFVNNEDRDLAADELAQKRQQDVDSKA